MNTMQTPESSDLVKDEEAKIESSNEKPSEKVEGPPLIPKPKIGNIILNTHFTVIIIPTSRTFYSYYVHKHDDVTQGFFVDVFDLEVVE